MGLSGWTQLIYKGPDHHTYKRKEGQRQEGDGRRAAQARGIQRLAMKVEEGAEAGGQEKLKKVNMWIFLSELRRNQPW